MVSFSALRMRSIMQHRHTGNQISIENAGCSRQRICAKASNGVDGVLPSRRPISSMELESLQSPRNTALYIPSSPSSSSGPSQAGSAVRGPHARTSRIKRGGQLALEGSYITELRMLEAIYTRARQDVSDPRKSEVRRRNDPSASPSLLTDCDAEGGQLQVPGSLSVASSTTSTSCEPTQTRAPEKHRQLAKHRPGHLKLTVPKLGQQQSLTRNVAESNPTIQQLMMQQLRQKRSPPAMLSHIGFTHASDMNGVDLLPTGGVRSDLERQQPMWMMNQHIWNRGKTVDGDKIKGTSSVQSILAAVTGTSEASLIDIIKKATPMACNFALLALGSNGRYSDIRKLVDVLQRNALANEHTYGAAVSALDQAGRFDMAIQYFEELYRKGIDVGPVCSSVLIKLCAQRRDLPLAFDIFHRLSGHSTLNRYTYNCLIHLCASLGRGEDAVSVLRMMYEDGGQDTLPDSYTFSALLRAIANSKQFSLLPRVYRDIQRSRITVDTEVWCMLIMVAGKAMQPGLAWQYYKDYSKGNPMTRSNYVDNALLGALSRHAPMKEVLSTYRQMLDRGLKPDEYTFNALLTSMARVGASLYAVQDIVGEINKWGVKINMHLGTSLINAYKRSPEMTFDDVQLTTLLMEKAHDVLTQLAADRLANSQTYGAVAGMHAQLGDVVGLKRVLSKMEAAGVALDGLTCISLAKSCEDGGLSQAAIHFLDRAEGMGVDLSEHVGDSADRPKKAIQWWKKKNRRL